MSEEVVINVSNVSKSFKLPHEKHGSIKSLFVSRFRASSRSYEKQQVLKDVSFQIHKGEFFGIVGRNGSGKSTLLKLLAEIYTPNNGSIKVEGKLIPFIELGVGFNPELTGRENVFLNGALLGFSKSEVEAMYDEIVEFAEIERFMDQKLKNYSSGMQVRLAFSIAIRAKGDILLLDEVLAVGDEAFQQKCVDVFEKYKAEKQTVILVTHDMESVKKFCSRAMLISEGEIVEIGNPSVVAEKYSKLNLDKTESNMLSNALNPADNHLGLKITYRDKSNKKTALFKCGDLISILTNYTKRDDFQYLVINIYKQSGEHVTGFRIPASTGESTVEVRALFSKGKYYTLIQAVDKDAAAVGDVVIGPDFVITTDRAPGIPGWSGLVPVDYKVIDS